MRDPIALAVLGQAAEGRIMERRGLRGDAVEILPTRFSFRVAFCSVNEPMFARAKSHLCRPHNKRPPMLNKIWFWLLLIGILYGFGKAAVRTALAPAAAPAASAAAEPADRVAAGTPPVDGRRGGRKTAGTGPTAA